MATRKIKDAKDLETNELIFFKGHAKATYMSDGSTVEDAINNISTSDGETGPQGPQGEQGPKGDDGVSVTSVVQTTTSSADGGSNVMTVTLSNGTKSTFTVKNGSKGSQGVQGPKGDTGATGANGTNGKDGADGEDGATFTPSVDANGNLSWTNNGGLTNPPTVNIKGPKGDSGEGGGSGEDIRYFTEFTVHEFITACENEETIYSSGLYDAIMNNKIICIPESRGALSGFIAASSYTYSDATELHVFECFLEYGQVTYEASRETEQIDADSLYGMFPISKAHRVIFCNELYDIKDNITYIVENEVNELIVAFYGGTGSTIRFKTGDNPVFESPYTILWPNGVMPEIEPNTYYELSLASYDNVSILAVLTPFKPVE